MLSVRTASHALQRQRPAAVLAAIRPLAALSQTCPTTPAQQRRTVYNTGNGSMFAGSGIPPNTYFRRERLPANTIIRFVATITSSPETLLIAHGVLKLRSPAAGMAR